jgi:hypothetical protein
MVEAGTPALHLALHELVERHVVLDVFRDAVAPFLGHGLEVGHAEGGIDVEFGQRPFSMMSRRPVGGIGLEEILHGDDGVGVLVQFLGRLVEQEFLEFVFEQFVLRSLKYRESGRRSFPESRAGQAAIHAGGAAQLVEGVELGRLVEQLAADVVDGLVPLLVIDLLIAGPASALTVFSKPSKNMRSIFMPCGPTACFGQLDAVRPPWMYSPFGPMVGRHPLRCRLRPHRAAAA